MPDALVNPAGEASRTSFRRPLSNAHWALAVALVAAWGLRIAILGVAPSAAASASALSISTLLIAAWSNHLRLQAMRGWQKPLAIAVATARDLALLLVAAVLFAIPLILVGAGPGMTPKARTGELVVAGIDARWRVTEQAEKTHSLSGAGIGVTVKLAGEATAAMVTDDGVIIVAGDRIPAVIVLRPTMNDGKVAWTCQGFPTSLMLSACR